MRHKTEMQAFGTSSRVGHDSSRFYGRKLYTHPAATPLPQNTHAKNDKTPPSHEQPVPPHIVNRLYNHTSQNMHELPSNSIHLSITSPPYNVGKEYDEDLTGAEYYDLLHAVWVETYRVLVPGGRACINIANIGRKPYIALNAMITGQMLDIGFLMRGEIIWDKSASAGTSCAWGSWCSASNPVLRDTHEYILIFSKGRYDRPARGKISTITKDEFLTYTKSVWTFPAESAKRVQHPAPYPIELPRRLIQLYSYTDDIVLDPFIGSGTSAVAALQSSRQYVGYDISPAYIALAQDRIDKEAL